MGIESDSGRFKEIIKGKIKKHLKRYAGQSEIWGKKGKDFVKIPIPRIDIPRIRFGKNDKGVGIGEGEEGDIVGRNPKQGQGQGEGKAGNKEGEHVAEIEITIDELAEILGEELELPYLDPNRKKKILEEEIRYNTVSRTGPESLRHNKRTFLEALKRSMAMGTYDPDDPNVIPVPADKRYKSYKKRTIWTTNAVIISIIDVSGSMGEEQKALARNMSFWINAWIRKNYKGVENRWIIHDASAREVDENTFFHTNESGGTIISTAYKLAEDIIKADYPKEEWNTYIFHFSDGDNWSGGDSDETIKIIHRLHDRVNLIGYGQVTSEYGSGQFYDDLENGAQGFMKIRKTKIESNNDILGAIKVFFGKGL